MTHGKHYSPITLKREGEKFKHVYRIKQDVYVTDVNATAFNLAHNIDGIIRVPNELYASIDSSQSRYAHFNLEFSGHRIGYTYALPRVLRHGFFRGEGDEEPPVLSFDDIYVARCVSVREHVPYSALRDKDFRNSVPEIQDENDLKKEMLFRYAVSLPFLTKQAIALRGVSITTLRIIKRNQDLKF